MALSFSFTYIPPKSSLPQIAFGEDAPRSGFYNDADSPFANYFRTVAADADFDAPHFVNGQGGDDHIVLSSKSELADDIVYGGSGNDTILSGGGEDTVYGGTGADNIFGEEGADTLYGGAGMDTINGGVGDDTMYGGIGDDTLYGSELFNYLLMTTGLQGRDTMYGGDGNDTLVGGIDADTATGGSGADLFVFVDAADFGRNAARDKITDFSRAEGDRIDLSGIDALAGGPLNDIFKFSTVATTAPGSIWVGAIDADGYQAVHVNLGLETTFLVHTVDGQSLQASDFHM